MKFKILAIDTLTELNRNKIIIAKTMRKLLKNRMFRKNWSSQKQNNK